MKEISRKITVDLSRRGSKRTVFTVQNDKGSRNLKISLTDDGAPYYAAEGTTAMLNYRRPDNVCGGLAAEIVDDVVSVYLHPIATVEMGIVVCSVSLFDKDANKLTSSEFLLDVAEQLYDGDALNESPQYALLDGLLKQVSKVSLEESARVAAENQRKIAESEREKAEIERDKKVNENLGVGGSVTLSSTGWSSLMTQSFNVSGLRETDLIIFYPSSDLDRAILANYRVFISPDTVGETVTASANAIPTSDISMRYFIIRGRVDEEV